MVICNFKRLVFLNFFYFKYNLQKNFFWDLTTFSIICLLYCWNGTGLLLPDIECTSCSQVLEDFQSYILRKLTNFRKNFLKKSAAKHSIEKLVQLNFVKILYSVLYKIFWETTFFILTLLITFEVYFLCGC